MLATGATESPTTGQRVTTGPGPNMDILIISQWGNVGDCCLDWVELFVLGRAQNKKWHPKTVKAPFHHPTKVVLSEMKSNSSCGFFHLGPKVKLKWRLLFGPKNGLGPQFFCARGQLGPMGNLSLNTSHFTLHQPIANLSKNNFKIPNPVGHPNIGTSPSFRKREWIVLRALSTSYRTGSSNWQECGCGQG